MVILRYCSQVTTHYSYDSLSPINDNRGDIIQLDVHKKALYHKPSYSPLWASRCHMELPSNFHCGRSSINPNTWIIVAKYLDSCSIDGVTKFQNEVAKHWMNMHCIRMDKYVVPQQCAFKRTKWLICSKKSDSQCGFSWRFETKRKISKLPATWFGCYEDARYYNCGQG